MSRRRKSSLNLAGAASVLAFLALEEGGALTAIIDLWGVPGEQIHALHAMRLGSVGPPIPFGKQWGVLRLLEKRTGDLRGFPKERAHYVRKVERKKEYQALQQWIEALKQTARPAIFVTPP